MMSVRAVITTTIVCVVTFSVAIGCTGSGASSSPTPGPAHGGPSRLDEQAFHLVVGDSLDLAQLFSSEVRRWSFVSTDSFTVPVTPTGKLRAAQPGSALVIATGPYPLAARDTLVVIVMPHREAVSRMVNEVCPNEDERGIASSQPFDSLPIIHEYHDCQRLIQGGQYSALVGIFAHPHVDVYQQRDSFANGRLAAIIVDFVTKKQLMPYRPLGILPGTNCLVLKSDSGGRWQAGIINQPVALNLTTRRYLPCRNDLQWSDVPASARAQLVVIPQRGFDMNGRPVAPPVARWDWDERLGINYIGVKCDAMTWCEIGPRGFTPSPPQPNAAGQPIFKGYYDEQYLADSTGSRVTGIWATILPGENARDTSAMPAGGGPRYHLSHLRINGRGDMRDRDWAYYLKKFFAVQTTPLPPYGRAATAELMIIPISAGTPYSLGATSAAGAPTGIAPPLGIFGVYAGESNSRWLGPKGVAFRSHPSSVVKVPVVRWRWKFDDEAAWGFCRPNGCCESFYAEM
jgi:hypothetical protein